ncbi:MAG: tRNA uridine-5-carboxymethylaminomethyl(34) synthesis GTPase MnmE [Trueperaceae bacterium]
MAQLPPTHDTITAVATAPGTGAVGIVRLSGPDAYRVADALFVTSRGTPPSCVAAGRARYGTIHDDGETIDEAVLVTFRAPRSYTGQDVVEFQTHGGPAVLRAVLDLCVRNGARLAGPGEFTLRAYLGGRLDLAQAESVMDLVNAQTDSARRNAALGLTGALGARLDQVQTDVTHAYAAVQAALDYPHEGVPEADLGAPLERAAADLRALLATAAAGRLAQSGARLALLGRPNAGKSSLLNALLGYERSIVSDVPGTTRDYLEAPLVLAGIPLTAIDTAGIRSTADAIEASGVAVARRIAANADLCLALLDRSSPLQADDLALLREVPTERTLVVASKSDLPPAWEVSELGDVPAGMTPLAVSARTGQGMEALQTAIAETLLGDAAGTEVWLTQERHVTALTAALERVEGASRAAHDASHDIASWEMQEALTALATVTGRGEIAEETLASIFARFCVGK